MKNTFKGNLIIGFGFSLLLLIVSSVASYISIKSLLNSSILVDHTGKVINKLRDALTVVKDAETGQRGYLLTKNEVFLNAYNGARKRSADLFKEIKVLIADNPQQLSDADTLLAASERRFAIMEQLVEIKANDQTINNEQILEGNKYMEDYMAIVARMQEREKILLASRTASLDRFTQSTPIFIVIAAILSILVTLISFYKVMHDFDRRSELQSQLIKKEEEVSGRIDLIHGIASKISAGDYKIRINDEGEDLLGSLSGSLNKMAVSLDESFQKISDKEWLQTGAATLNEKLIGEKNIDALTYHATEFIVAYTNAQVGAFYLLKDLTRLWLSASVALNNDQVKKEIQLGEGLAGQCARSQKIMQLENISDSEIRISYTSGSIQPVAVIAVPVFFEGRLIGVIEIASLEKFSTKVVDFLKMVSFNIGIAINSAIDHQKLEELLHETQAQSEELQAQHAEMENVNAELEAQSEKLQASEEELRVQQEELQQSNAELEERSSLLEEKNELILERNLAIQSKAEELALSTKYKSEFLANMSHELRTPLNSILLLSRLLSENHVGNLSTDQVEYATVIQSSGNALLTLIDEILDLSKIESGKMELEYTNVFSGSVIQEIRSLFLPIAKDKGIDFIIQENINADETIEIDRLRLEQILRNLISNALKFTKKGSVTLTTRKDNTHIYFEVKDTGIGISQDKHHTIFEAFQQADGSTRRKYGGTGLGLSISRELARLLGGEIMLKSNEGKGSEFTLVLPLQKGSTYIPAGKLPKEELALSDNKTFISSTPVANGNNYLSTVIPASIPDDRDNITEKDKVILIIEDDTAFARSLQDYTRANGYKCIVSVRGDEGIMLAKKFLPLGILLDLQLPVKSGWDVMDALKSDPVTRPIPVHMMSSYEVKTKSISKGAIDFINKPVAFEQLAVVFSRIEKALSNYPKKVLIVEENPMHARALAYFLEGFNVASEIKESVNDGIKALTMDDVDCVILDMGLPSVNGYDTLEQVKKTKGLENLPIIIFTGKNLSHIEEMRIKQYADSIVVKTAHSYQRILDEVSLFLHLVEENKQVTKPVRYKKMGELEEVLKGKTILVADDDVRNIFSITKSLEKYGINVVSAIDGKEALKQLQEQPVVDLILMDMMMPEMDGYESSRRIRLNPKYKNLPIIAVTAKAMTGDREKCIVAGASDYITKPVDVDQLISLLRVWLYE